MTYEFFRPPFSLDFERMSKEELKAYYAWFIEQIPRRIRILETALRETPGTENWSADYSEGSLGSLGTWFFHQVQTRPTTTEEKSVQIAANANSKIQLPIPDETLTEQTLSVAVDIGIYFGELLRHQLPGLKWGQEIKSKKSVDYGQALLFGTGKLPLNPIQITMTLAHGIERGTRTGQELLKLRAVWAKLLMDPS